MYGATIESVKEGLMDPYANSPIDRTNLIKSLLESDPFDVQFKKDKNARSINIEQVKSALKCLSYEIVPDNEKKE